MFKNYTKHAVHDIHKLAWGPCARWAPGQLPLLHVHEDGTAAIVWLVNFHLRLKSVHITVEVVSSIPVRVELC